MLSEGQTVGSYRIGSQLGDGGFATVFRAVHVGLESQHAIKVLKPELVGIEEIRMRFLAEARIQAGINHPNIVRVTDILALDGVAAIVMDFVPGEPLSAWIAAQKAPPSPERVREIVLPLLDALAHAHANGIVHRDLKPDNILLERTATEVLVPKVADFGIAKVRGELGARANKRSTMADRRMGTHGYMSPEQIRSAKDVDARADVFALGVVLLELATLAHPFDRPSEFDTMQAIVTGDYTIPPDLWARDPAVAAAARVALSPVADDRYPDCASFAAAIGTTASSAKPSSAPASAPPPKSASPPKPTPKEAPPKAPQPPPKAPQPPPKAPQPPPKAPQPSPKAPQPPPPPKAAPIAPDPRPPAPAARSSSLGFGCLGLGAAMGAVALCCGWLMLPDGGGHVAPSPSLPTVAAPTPPPAPPSPFRASGDAPDLIVGTGRKFPPMFDTTVAPPTGFDVALADELARRLGKRGVSLRTPSSGVRDAAQAGEVDLSVAAISITSERAQETLFSVPYLEPSLVVAMLPERTAEPTAGLSGYRCVAAHEQYEPAVDASGCQRVPARNLDKALAKVQAGEADFVVLDAVEAGQLPEPWRVAGAPIGADEYGVAMQLGNDELKAKVDRAIADMRADGTLDALVARYQVYGAPRAALPPEPTAMAGAGADAVPADIPPNDAPPDPANPRIAPMAPPGALSDPTAVVSMIRETIDAHAPDVKACFDGRLQTLPELSGAWITRFTVRRDGTTAGVDVTGTGMRDPVFEACLSGAVRAWRFSPIATDQPITKTWRLESR